MKNEPADIIIPGSSVGSMILILTEAGNVMANMANKMNSEAAPDDWQTKTAALLVADHVKKMAWVASLLKPKECEVCGESGHKDRQCVDGN